MKTFNITKFRYLSKEFMSLGIWYFSENFKIFFFFGIIIEIFDEFKNDRLNVTSR